MICANPDLVVERGDQLVYCAGAIAEPMRELGGEVLYAGKPHRPIYEAALALARRRSAAARSTPAACWRSATAVRTDIAGARRFGVRLPVRRPAASTPRS